MAKSGEKRGRLWHGSRSRLIPSWRVLFHYPPALQLVRYNPSHA
jgi:hypothetical protein